MSRLDRLSGRRHAAQLLQDGAEVQTLMEATAAHPVFFAQGMLDVLNNPEVVAVLTSKRGGTLPPEKREQKRGYAKKLENGWYESYIIDSNGKDVFIGTFPDRHRARHARDTYTDPNDKPYYLGLIEHMGGWLVRRRVDGKEFRSRRIDDYDQAVIEWHRIDDLIKAHKLLKPHHGDPGAGDEKRP